MGLEGGGGSSTELKSQLCGAVSMYLYLYKTEQSIVHGMSQKMKGCR